VFGDPNAPDFKKNLATTNAVFPVSMRVSPCRSNRPRLKNYGAKTIQVEGASLAQQRGPTAPTPESGCP
jgi:hypothetical protein